MRAMLVRAVLVLLALTALTGGVAGSAGASTDAARGATLAAGLVSAGADSAGPAAAVAGPQAPGVKLAAAGAPAPAAGAALPCGYYTFDGWAWYRNCVDFWVLVYVDTWDNQFEYDFCIAPWGDQPIDYTSRVSWAHAIGTC